MSTLPSRYNIKTEYIIKYLYSLKESVPESFLNYESDFQLLVAIILSAQCSDNIVNKVTSQLFALCPTAYDIQVCSENLIAKIIRPCGCYKNKTKFIQATANIIVNNFDNMVPPDLQQLIQLPGVGIKTAKVFLAQYYKQPWLPVDRHIQRCAKRWLLSTETKPEKISEELEQLFPLETHPDLHIRLIWYARNVCTSKKHILQKCPICWFVYNLQQNISI